MPNALRKPWITPQDYLAAERVAEVRHEYVDGEVFAMMGASRRPGGWVADVVTEGDVQLESLDAVVTLDGLYAP